jgi:hypothetical protein
LSEPYGSVRGIICRFVRFDLVIRRERGVCWKSHLDEGAAVVVHDVAGRLRLRKAPGIT